MKECRGSRDVAVLPYVMYVQYKVSQLYSISCRFVCDDGTLCADQIGYVPEFLFSEIVC